MKKRRRDFFVLCFCCFLSLLLCGCAEKEYFFDFHKEGEECFVGEYTVDILSKDKVVFVEGKDFVKEADLCGNENKWIYDQIYKVELKKKWGYFKFSSLKMMNDSVVLFNKLRWIKNPPRGSLKNTKLKFYSVHLPFVQPDTVTLCTVGDSQTWYQHGQELRKKLSNRLGFNFVGNHQDVYGFYHSGEGGNKTKDVLDRTDEIPSADIYSVFIGTNDWKFKEPDKTFENIMNIITKLKDKNPKAEFFVTTIPLSDDFERNEHGRSEINEKVNNMLKEVRDSLAKESVFLVDLNARLKRLSLNNYLSDGLHLNKRGYSIYTELLSQEVLEKSNYVSLKR